MTRTSISLIAVLAAGALAAGCGSSSNGSSSKTMSKADFQKQANAICRGYNARIAKLGSPSGFADIGPYTRKAIAATDDAFAKLRALNPPKDLQGDYSQFLSYSSTIHATANKLIAAASKKDVKGLQKAVAEGNKGQAKSNAIARRLGLTECAKP